MPARKVAPHAWKGHAWGDSPFCTKCGRLESHRYHQPQENPVTCHAITAHEAPGESTIDITRVTPGTYVIWPNGASDDYAIALAFKSLDKPHGITMEALLAVCADRLEQFQQGPTACAENANVLMNLRASIATLHGRTRRREVEGTTGTAAP